MRPAPETSPPAGAPSKPVKRSTLRRLFSITRAGVLLLLVGHLLACAGVLLLMPGGWPWKSMEMLGYRILPAGVGVALIAAVSAPKRWPIARLVVATLLILWITFMIACPIVFAMSGWRIVIGASAVNLVLALALASIVRSETDHRWRPRDATAMLGVPVALLVVSLLHAPAVSTHPIASGGTFGISARSAAHDMLPQTNRFRLNSTVAFDPTQATVVVNAGRRYAYIEPLLAFTQRSPDACWTIFSSRDQRAPFVRRLRATTRQADVVLAEYAEAMPGDADAESEAKTDVAWQSLALRVGERNTTQIETYCDLTQPVWSHLNAFTTITTAGHHRLALRFSAAPAVAI